MYPIGVYIARFLLFRIGSGDKVQPFWPMPCAAASNEIAAPPDHRSFDILAVEKFDLHYGFTKLPTEAPTLETNLGKVEKAEK